MFGGMLWNQMSPQVGSVSRTPIIFKGAVKVCVLLLLRVICAVI